MGSGVAPWKVSLHGGHSGEFCDHATGTLREVIEAAIAGGFEIYGISEHAPRHGERYRYANERDKGWTLEKILADFEAYGEAIFRLAKEYADRITILRGYEIEVVPHDRYAEIMLDYRKRFRFDYMVGSVHYLHDISIDSSVEEFERVMEIAGGLEALAVEYYAAVSGMIEALEPEVVGHLDLVRKNGHLFGPLDTPAIRKAAERALEVAKAHDCILDLNTAGWRKGLDSPYPAPWLLQRANEMGVPFCFGDDSHGPELVGAGIPEAREYLFRNGVTAVTVLDRRGESVERRRVAL
ncbi:MAG: histidinol-phosphatase [Candidatus Hydrogenedentes bacterium]|nr:histidinol-phosphatase [Candidatus Hydrogenedentota bacterium]